MVGILQQVNDKLTHSDGEGILCKYGGLMKNFIENAYGINTNLSGRDIMIGQNEIVMKAYIEAILRKVNEAIDKCEGDSNKRSLSSDVDKKDASMNDIKAYVSKMCLGLDECSFGMMSHVEMAYSGIYSATNREVMIFRGAYMME
jgi:hypothetical protein